MRSLYCTGVTVILCLLSIQGGVVFGGPVQGNNLYAEAGNETSTNSVSTAVTTNNATGIMTTASNMTTSNTGNMTTVPMTTASMTTNNVTNNMTTASMTTSNTTNNMTTASMSTASRNSSMPVTSEGPMSSPTKPQTSTAKTTTTTPAPKSSKFSGASFGGGIALGVVLAAILSFGIYKYKSRNAGYSQY